MCVLCTWSSNIVQRCRKRVHFLKASCWMPPFTRTNIIHLMNDTVHNTQYRKTYMNSLLKTAKNIYIYFITRMYLECSRCVVLHTSFTWKRWKWAELKRPQNSFSNINYRKHHLKWTNCKPKNIKEIAKKRLQISRGWKWWDDEREPCVLLHCEWISQMCA